MTTPEDREIWERDEEALRDEHHPAIANYYTSDGVKWRWSCVCGVGDTVEFVSAYTNVGLGILDEVGGLLARAALDRHLERAALEAERDELRAEVERLRRDVADNWVPRPWLGRAKAAEAKLARVEKLRDEWEHGRHLLLEWNVPIAETAATALRAVLADAPSEQQAEGGW
jgi:hypothetical protein